jgi:hypothetical protein
MWTIEALIYNRTMMSEGKIIVTCGGVVGLWG